MYTPRFYPELPKIEVFIYFILWVGLYTLSMKQVYDLSMTRAYQRNGILKGHLEVRKDYFTSSVPLKDVSDFEWDLWNYWILQMIIYPYIFYFIYMRCFERFYSQHRFQASMIFSFGFCIYFFDLKGLLIVLGQSITIFSISYFTKSMLATWICYLATLLSLNSHYALSHLQRLYADDQHLVMFICMMSMCGLRVIAFCSEFCWSVNANRQDNSDLQGFARNTLNLLIYEFYFPLFVGGPIINYDEFHRQTKQKRPVEWSITVFCKYIFGILRYGFWHIVLNFWLHLSYFSSIHTNLRMMNKVSLLTLCGLAASFTQFFCSKYMVLYGLPSKFARGDNIEVSGASHCVSGKYTFTDMWKYFDKGLHKWLVRYIFIPMGGSRSSYIWSVVTSVVVFSFVYLWHGATDRNLAWAILNWFGVFVEKVAGDIYKREDVQSLEKKYLSPANSRRIRAAISTPLFSLLIISNLYFLAGIQSANIHLRRVYTEDLLSTLLIHVVLYFGAQIAMEFSRNGI